MRGDKLSRGDDRRLHRALESIALTEFPNPERLGCPGPEVLQAMAVKGLPMRHAAFEHVGKCSPCFREVHEMRRTMRQRRLLWMAGTALVVFAASAISYFLFRSVEPPRETSSSPTYENASLD